MDWHIVCDTEFVEVIVLDPLVLAQSEAAVKQQDGQDIPIEHREGLIGRRDGKSGGPERGPIETYRESPWSGCESRIFDAIAEWKTDFRPAWALLA